jgi:hypothetical protein
LTTFGEALIQARTRRLETLQANQRGDGEPAATPSEALTDQEFSSIVTDYRELQREGRHGEERACQCDGVPDPAQPAARPRRLGLRLLRLRLLLDHRHLQHVVVVRRKRARQQQAVGGSHQQGVVAGGRVGGDTIVAEQKQIDTNDVIKLLPETCRSIATYTGGVAPPSRSPGE